MWVIIWQKHWFNVGCKQKEIKICHFWFFHRLGKSSFIWGNFLFTKSRKIKKNLNVMVARQRQKFSPDRRGDLAWCNWRVKLNVHIGRHWVLSHMMLIVKAKCQLGGPPFSRSIQFLGFFCSLHVYLEAHLKEQGGSPLPGQRSSARGTFSRSPTTFNFQFNIETQISYRKHLVVKSFDAARLGRPLNPPRAPSPASSRPSRCRYFNQISSLFGDHSFVSTKDQLKNNIWLIGWTLFLPPA